MRALDPPFVSCRSVGGHALRFEWDDAGLTGPVEATLSYLGSDSETDAPGDALRVRFSTRAAPLAVPAGADLLSESPEGLQFLRQSDALYLRFRDAVVRVEPRDGTADGVLPGEAGPLRDAVVYSLTFYGLVALLYARGVRTLHAACVVYGDAGCLIVGESDSGKSTLTLRLVEQGWGYLTDDSVLLREAGGHVEARPLRRDFCLDPEAEALFPDAAARWEPHLADARKQRLHVRDLYPGRAAGRCVPRLVLFPQIVPEAASRLVPLSPRDTLLGLLRQTGAPAWLDGPAAAAHLGDLRRLAGQAQGYALLAGRDLRDSPAAAAALTRRLVGAPDRRT